MRNLKNICFAIVAMLIITISNAQISKAEIRATGLTCSMCSNAINKQLKSLKEVLNVEIDLNSNTFKVSLMADNKLSPKIFKDKVEEAGFFIGSLVITVPSNITNSKAYIFVETENTTSNEIQIKVLDKGYVTSKEYKKLLKSLIKIETYALHNEDDFHIKLVK